jgi:hypothetical protein
MKSKHLSLLKKANAALLERGDTDCLADYFSPNYVAHITGKDVSGGYDLIKHIVTLYHKAFSGITTKVDILTRLPSSVAKDHPGNTPRPIQGVSCNQPPNDMAGNDDESIRGRPHCGGMVHYRSGRTTAAGQEITQEMKRSKESLQKVEPPPA